MRLINIIKVLGIITSLFLLPSISNAQIQRVWNIPEFLSTMPVPPSAGAKIGFRTINNSVYYWNGSAWVRMAGPGIVDTMYSLSFTSPTLSLLGSGSSVSLTNLYTPGWGLLKTAEEFRVDSSKVASRYHVSANFFPLQGGTLTGTGGAGFVGFPSQVSAPGTPASGLNVFAQGSSFNWKGTDGYERQFASTLTGGRTYTLPDVSGTFALGTGTTNRVPLWTSINMLGSSNIQDNGTAVSVLNSKPFQLGQWTTAGRPSGVAAYNGYNTTLGGNEWYDGTRWNSVPKAVKSAFTSTYIPFTNSSGQFDENANFVWDNTQVITGGGTGQMRVGGSNDGGYGRIFINGRVSFRREFIMDRSAGGFGAFFSFTQRNAGEVTALGTATGITGAAELFTYQSPLIFGTFSSGSGVGNLSIITGSVNRIFINETGLISMGVTGGGVIASTRLGVRGVGTTSSNYTARFDNSTGTNFGLAIRDDGLVSIGSAPVTSAQLSVTSTTGGILPPRWTAAQLAAISSPATGLFGYQTDGAEGLYAKYASGWKRHLVEGDVPVVNIYTGDGTFGAGRIGTLTDSIRFRFGGSDLFRLKSNGVAHFNMPTESNSFVITSTPSENYNNYRGNVFLTGTSSEGDTTTGNRRNNHEASYFSGINLVEGGNNVYYDAVAGYGNIVRGNNPKNIIYGVYNTITGLGDVGVYGYGNTVSGQYVTVVGRENAVSANNSFVVGRSNTVNTANAFVYGNSIGSANATLHGFGTVAPTARMHVKSLAGAATLFVDGGYAQIDAKLKIGSDSSFVHDPSQDTTYIKGDTRIQSGSILVEKTSGSPRLSLIAKGSSGNQEAGIYMKSRGNFSPIIEIDAASPTSSAKFLPFYNYNTNAGGKTIFRIGGGNGFFGANSIGQFTVRDSLDVSRRFSFNSNGTAVFDLYGTSATTAATLGKTESGYLTSFATDGTVLSKPDNTERYNTVTSTTSPVTLSSTIADNLINQGSTQATFTFRLPASPVDGQISKATFANAVTVLTIDGNGTTVTGTLPTTVNTGTQIVFKNYTGLGWVRQL